MLKILFFSYAILISTLSFSQWTPITAPPNNFRTDHSFGFSISGVGYLVAGTDNTNTTTADFYSYNPLTDQWTQLNDFPGGTRGYGIGDIIDGKAYFGFGSSSNTGQSNQQNDLWEFDPATGQWTELASCPCAARRHPALVASQGKIFMGLGDNSTVGNLNDWWEYDIATDNWTQKTLFPGFNRHHPYQFAIGDNVYVGFGHGNQGSQIYKDWYSYNPTLDTWTQVSDITGQARVAGTQFSHNGFGYILSGDGQTHNSMPVGEFWRYDASNDSWLQLPSHPGKSRWAPASFVINDEVYLINGAETPNYIYPNTSFKLNLNSLVGLAENLKDNKFSVYPNPFTSEITFDFSELEGKENLSVQLYNALGEKVFETDLGKDSDTKIDLSFLEKGLYWAEILSGDKNMGSRKLVKVQ
jgi:N-acetylneuraminic acid mutarotase